MKKNLPEALANLDNYHFLLSIVEIFDDLIKAAINDAKSKAEVKTADETQKMMADLGLPAGVKLPF